MKINNKDLEATWGCFLEDGGGNTFWQTPKPKPRFTYSRSDESGDDMDDDEVLVFEPILFVFPLIFCGADAASVSIALDSFIEEIKSPFAMTVEEVGKSFAKCYFMTSGDTEIITDSPFAIRIEFTFKYNW